MMKILMNLMIMDMELISNVEYWSNDSNNIDPKIENQDEN